MITVKPSAPYGPAPLMDEYNREQKQAYSDIAAAIQDLKLASVWLMGQMGSCTECDILRSLNNHILQAEAELWKLKNYNAQKNMEDGIQTDVEKDFRTHFLRKLRDAMTGIKDGDPIDDTIEELQITLEDIRRWQKGQQIDATGMQMKATLDERMKGSTDSD